MFKIFKTYSNKSVLTGVIKNTVDATTESHLMEKPVHNTIDTRAHPP